MLYLLFKVLLVLVFADIVLYCIAVYLNKGYDIVFNIQMSCYGLLLLAAIVYATIPEYKKANSEKVNAFFGE